MSLAVDNGHSKELESNGQSLSFSVTLSADSCFAAILKFVLVIVAMVEVRVP